MTMRSKIAVVMLASCLGAGAAINAAQAADLIVSSLGPANFVLTALIPMFEAATTNKVAITYETGAALLTKVRSGADLDLAILPPQAIDDLVNEGSIAAGRPDIFIPGLTLPSKPAAPHPHLR